MKTNLFIFILQETFNSQTGLWDFTCQHGDLECWGNLVHSCVIHYNPKTEQHLPFINCMEADTEDDIQTAAFKCAQKFDIPHDQISACIQTEFGNSLEHEMAVKTQALNPPHKYVPWVTLNGVHTEDIETKAMDDLVKLICDIYTVNINLFSRVFLKEIFIFIF